MRFTIEATVEVNVEVQLVTKLGREKDHARFIDCLIEARGERRSMRFRPIG